MRSIEKRSSGIATLVVITVLTSIATLANGFAFGDVPIVANNPGVHSLARL